MVSIRLLVLGILIVFGVALVGCGSGAIGPEEVTPDIERQDQEAMDKIGEQESAGIKGLVDVVDEDPVAAPPSN